MIRLLLKTVITVVLVLFPFWGSIVIIPYTPYTEGNSATHYVLAYGLFALVVAVLLFYSTSRFKDAFMQPVLPGITLFFFGVVMLGIAGLKSGPDISTAMLDHPEREHVRYAILAIGAFLFGFYFIQLFSKNTLNLKPNAKWLMMALFVIALLEIFWEFHHHYFYPEALKEWVHHGNKAEDFNKKYDNNTIGCIGSAGRFVIYILMTWLSIGLYRVKRVNLWSPIVTTFLGTLGVVSSIYMFLYFYAGIETPKSLGFLFIFFIPGISFLILYWIGTALLTKQLLSNTKT